jgi:hypothetical protein
MGTKVWQAAALVTTWVSVPASAAWAGHPPRPADDAPAAVALVVAWPDGRAIYELTTARRASTWTTRFLRDEGYRPPDGVQPVYAVQWSRVLVGRDIMVDVSVLLGSAEPPGVPVASVRIAAGSSVVVRELRRFGVQPVTLSMIDVAAMTPFLPTVVSVSPQIEIADVESHAAPYPGYRITLRNLADRPVSNVHVHAYRGTEKGLSTIKRSDDGGPLMQPGATYRFDLNLTTGATSDVTAGTWTPRPIDVIELDWIRWADGTQDGQSPLPGREPMLEERAGRRLQLRRVVGALRETLATSSPGPELVARAAARLASLPDAEPDQLEAAASAMRTIKTAALADVARVARAPGAATDTGAVVEQLTAVLRRYEAWLTRLSPP